MPDRRDGSKKIMTSAGKERRRFFAKAAAAAVGAYAAATSSHSREPCHAAAPSGCPGVKTPMKDVAGKVAFITGGSSGIGLGIAKAFVDAGMKVAIGYRTAKHMDEAMEYLGQPRDRVHAIRVDVTDRPAMERAAAEVVKTFGKVHVLVNNAGVGTTWGLRQTTYDDWDWVLGVNCTGVFNGVRAFLPHLESHSEGAQIIATSSVLGLFAMSAYGGYSASKFAVVGLMETLRMELEGTNIGVSVYCPGGVRSNNLEADRNRPSSLSNAGAKSDPAMTAAFKKAVERDPGLVMDPLEAGRVVLRGMRNNDLYILSHPEFEASIRERNEAVEASTPRDVTASEARLKSAMPKRDSVYAIERDRKRCAR